MREAGIAIESVSTVGKGESKYKVRQANRARLVRRDVLEYRESYKRGTEGGGGGLKQ